MRGALLLAYGGASAQQVGERPWGQGRRVTSPAQKTGGLPPALPPAFGGLGGGLVVVTARVPSVSCLSSFSELPELPGALAPVTRWHYKPLSELCAQL